MEIAMRRWNGWGAEETTYPLPDSAAAYLAGSVRDGLRLEDASIAQPVRSVPPTHLSHHPAISVDEKLRWECGLLILRGACSIRMGA